MMKNKIDWSKEVTVIFDKVQYNTNVAPHAAGGNIEFYLQLTYNSSDRRPRRGRVQFNYFGAICDDNHKRIGPSFRIGFFLLEGQIGYNPPQHLIEPLTYIAYHMCQWEDGKKSYNELKKNLDIIANNAIKVYYGWPKNENKIF
jgi:hypothetical protein